MEGRAVSVYGLPEDVDHERLRDKLLIHFLRQRNGGGEVTSVTIIRGTSLRALITFEESRVAESVLRHHPHILQLNGIKYELSLSLPSQEPLSLNKVILGMIVTIDCSQFSQGADALNELLTEFPGLQMQRGLVQQTCSLQGTYSDFQRAFPYMLTLISRQPSRAEYPNLTGHRGQGTEKREDLSSLKKLADFSAESLSLHAGDLSSLSTVGSTEERYRLQDKNKALTGRSTRNKKSKMEEGAECRMDETDLEDLSIIMEADVFAYLQSIKEYQHILSNHEVHVVHVTSEGVTTLYLQSEVPNRSGMKQNIWQAHKELTQLYQQQEACLRKDQIQKSALYMPDGLATALQNVQSVLPNILLSYDQDSVYIVGEKREVSQAKQMLLLGAEERVTGSLAENSASSSSEKEQQVKRNSEVYTPVPPKLFSSSTERKGEVCYSKEYKLAARFKSSGLGLTREELGGDMRSVTAKTDMQKSAATRTSVGTSGVPSPGLTEEGAETFEITPNHKGEGVQNMLPASAFYGSTIRARPTTTNSPLSMNPSVNASAASNTEVNAAAPALRSATTPKQSLRRVNSFSGRLNLKEQEQNKSTTEMMTNAHAHPRSRSSSLSGGESSEGCTIPTVEAELTVSFLMWNYMKEVFGKQLDAMKSDLQMSEKQAGKGETSVMLKGTDSSKIEASHRELQNLVAIVASDFCIQELPFTEIGVVEKDKLFETCCLNVRSRFPKVILHITKSSVFLLGPKLLCTQASDIFKVVFSGQRMKTLQEGANQGAAKASLGIQSTKAAESVKVPSSHMNHSNSFQNEVKSTKLKSAMTEKLESPKFTMEELGKTNSPTLLSNSRDEPNLDGPTSSLEARNKQDKSLDLKQTNLLSHNFSQNCVCGAADTDVKRTTCGVVLCSACLELHSHCRVCGKEEVCSQKKERGELVQSSGLKDSQQEYHTREERSRQEDRKEHKGIQGTMTCVELPLSLTGYKKFTTAKITYLIPDGVQGDQDPCPGSPFKGDKFEAYLPLDPKGRSLLPLLEKAFHQGLTFAIISSKKAGSVDAKVNWAKIPHKTKMEGGKSSNGFPDSTYFSLLSEALVAHGIEGATAINQDQAKSRPSE